MFNNFIRLNAIGLFTPINTFVILSFTILFERKNLKFVFYFSMDVSEVFCRSVWINTIVEDAELNFGKKVFLRLIFSTERIFQTIIDDNITGVLNSKFTGSFRTQL